MITNPIKDCRFSDIFVSLVVMSAYLALNACLERLGTYWGLSEALFPAVLLLGLQGLLILVLLFIFRLDKSRALALTLFVTFLSCQHYHFLLKMGVTESLLMWTGLLLGGSLLLLVSLPLRRIFIPAMTLYIVIFMTITVLQIGIYLNHKTYNLSLIPPRQNLLQKAQVDLKTAPDIYFLLQDAYAYPRTLRRIYNFDNTEFIEHLRGRGFYVAEDSRSYYSQTMLSVASTLNLNYIQDDIILPHSDFADRGPAIRHYLRPRLVEFLLGQGYQIEMRSTGYDLDTDTLAHKSDIRGDSFRLSAVQVLVSRTPFYPVLDQLFGRKRHFLNPHRDHYDDIREGYKFLESQVRLETTSRPRFVYAHILLPHPPFVFDAEGNFTDGRHQDQFAYKDGRYNKYGHLYDGGWQNHYRTGYIAQVQAANKMISSFVDEALKAPSERPKVIIIQGDHGSRLMTNFSSMRGSDLDEIFGVMNAVYFSDEDYHDFSQNISPLNVMRLMVNKYFDAGLPLLDNQSWYSTWHEPYKFELVNQEKVKAP